MVEHHALPCLDRQIRPDTSGSRDGYLLIGSRGTPIRLSSSAYHLLKAVRAGMGFEALAKGLSRGGHSRFFSGCAGWLAQLLLHNISLCQGIF